jgi:hypothetical protein
MKGFPNQVSNLSKLSSALAVAHNLADAGKNIRSDEVYGEALVRAGVAGTGHSAMPVEDYLKEQKKKTASNRSFQTTARGLRELFRILGLLTDDGEDVFLTSAGEEIAGAYEQEHEVLTPELLEMWRTVIRNMTHQGGYGSTSHPYQVLLRLIAKRPGISRAKCALALEAKDDSEEELNRIVALSDADEDDIQAELGISKTNWDNAKKILPSFAEQLGDASKTGDALYLSASPGAPGDGLSKAAEAHADYGTKKKIKKPKSASKVGAGTIAKAGTLDTYDEVDDETGDMPDPEAIAARKEKLLGRLKRHNLIVQQVAAVCEQRGAELFENPFDCLACFEETSLLIEVKSLDGTEPDERARVRDALGQLLYYEAFVTDPYAGGRSVMKVAVFESQISDEHAEWLRSSSIEAVWLEGDEIRGNAQTVELLAPYFGDDIAAS